VIEPEAGDQQDRLARTGRLVIIKPGTGNLDLRHGDPPVVEQLTDAATISASSLSPFGERVGVRGLPNSR
jgi:hypothetical protein